MTAASGIGRMRVLRLLLTSLAVSMLLMAGTATAAAEPAPPGGGQATTAPGNASTEAGTAPDAAGSAPVPIRGNLAELEDEVMCPICGTLLGMSRAPAAERQRAFMRQLIREGKTDDQIKDALVAEYGPQVLGLPDDDEINFFVYLVPLFGLIIGALAVLWAAVRWRRQRDPDEPGLSSGNDPAREPGGTDSTRLDRDLADYDL